MSILKYVSSNSRQSLAAMYQYLTDKEKTDLRHGLIGYGLNPQYADKEMAFVQRLHHFEGSFHVKQYQHVIFAFDVGVCYQYSLDLIYRISNEIGWAILPDRRQMLGAIHYKNTDKVHCHYMMNYINLDGDLYRQQHPLHYYKNRVNAVLQAYGLNKIDCFTPYIDYLYSIMVAH